MSTIEKDTSKFVIHGTSLETPAETLTEYLTPTSQFFVCNSGSTPLLSSDDYSLQVWGSGVSCELLLSYQELINLPRRTVPAVLECAGNNRAFFRDVQGETLVTRPGTAELIWSTGAVGMAEWTGVSLCDVLELAGVKKNAVHVCALGSETDSCEGEIRMPMPLDKAMDPDTLVAIEMNGQPLPADHGFPVRLLVPGWIGAYSVKWVENIEVSLQPIWVRRNTESYVLEGELWPAEKYAPSRGARITKLNIKSSLALPWPATLSSGTHSIHGFARSPGTKISSVQWSEDNGISWSDAELVGPSEPYGWARFQFTWIAQRGERVLMTRAIDQEGVCQPVNIPFNAGGYLYNAIHPHPVVVC